MAQGPYGVLTTIGICLGVLPCAIVLSHSSWLLLGLWLVLGGVRWRLGHYDAGIDSAILGIIFAFLSKDALLDYWKMLDLSNGSVGASLQVTALAFTVSLVLFGVSYYLRLGFTRHSGSQSQNNDTAALSSKYPRSLIYQCRTTHVRSFPKRHYFSHSYLLYGIPITPAGTKPDGTGLTTSKDLKTGRWWMHVKADDYLIRGHRGLGFYGKLKVFLRGEGVPDTEWSYAYLVTAPRVFGYSFNKISFWYIYDQSHELKRMIVEANNTYGERRIQLLDGSCSVSPVSTPTSEVSQPDGPMMKFTDIWLKDFHASPFNSRKGSYSLKALNPFPTPDFLDAQIDNTITLRSSKDHVKIVARCQSTHPPINADRLNFWVAVRLIAGWWWIGLATYPRMLREAARLYFHRKLNIWYRPEVLHPSLGRKPTSTEITVQNIFRDYLQQLVSQSSEQWNISYHTAIPERPKEMIASTHVEAREIVPKRLEIRVLTPVFYSRFVHYAHTWEAFDREGIFTDERNRTLWISNPELLPLLLQKPRVPVSENYKSSRVKRSRLEDMMWSLLKRLRCPPPQVAYPVATRLPSFNADDIRAIPFSDVDIFVRSLHGRSSAALYRRTVMRMFLAQRFTFGFIGLVDALDLAFRILLCYIGATALLVSSTAALQWDASEVLWREGWDLPYKLWRMLPTFICVCSCHFYGLLKGYS